MQDNSKPIPFFPENLQDYAPWVAKYGLLAPYGECQCGCGAKTRLTHCDLRRGYSAGSPVRYLLAHVGGRARLLEQALCVDESSGTRLIPLTRNRLAIVDVADYEWLMGWNWHAIHGGSTWYAGRVGRNTENRKTIFQMHRVILDAPKGVLVDHADGNGLNNTRLNIRLATNTQNTFNRKLGTNNTSGHLGVIWNKKERRWIAIIGFQGKHIRVGSYVDIQDAVRARDEKARELYGEFVPKRTESEAR